MTVDDAVEFDESGTSIPSGTVTFLFTDIEGSTRLLEELRQGYATLLAEQRTLLRASFEEWNGFEVDTQGDSFFVAFRRAIDALNCAVAAQRSIATHEWPNGVKLRVRMALHTGEPIVQRTGYVGMDVHRAARIGSAGHGGQILVSQTTRELVAADLPVGLELRSLGRHRLKDVRQPVEIFQVEAAGLQSDFPALRTLETGDEPPTPGEPPFKGLEYFDEADAALFFGRQRLTERLVGRLTTERFLAVIGASGSGKSSLVRAGVLPVLRRQTARHWLIASFTPGARPLEALALAVTSNRPARETADAIDALAGDERALHLLARRANEGAGPDSRLLLVVDQFEEVFTLCRDEAERGAFIANLLNATLVEGPTSVLLTLRADFYDRLAVYDLRPQVAEHQEYIGAMSSAELREAIEGPARHGGWEFSPGLVELILHDVGQEPGALPLLSHALLETWRRRRGTTMTLKAYAESGGVRGAIGRSADRVFHLELDTAQQAIARSIFLRLTELGEGTQDTRRRVAREELEGGSPENADASREVLAKLVDARLVTAGEDSIEVAHEALIREWPTLREWLSEDRDGLRVHRHLTEAALEWEILERDPGALYRGARLASAREWVATHDTLLNEQERAFVAASEAQQNAEDAEREAQQRREIEAAEQLAATQAAAARRLRRRALLLTGALVVAGFMGAAAILLGLSAQQSASQAEKNFATAESQRLAGESSTLLQLQGSAELASLLALRGLAADYSPQADMALQRAARQDFGALLLRTERQVDTIDVSPDGRLLLAYSRDGTAHVWSLGEGSLVWEAAPGPRFSSAEFTPDGSHIVLTNEERTEIRNAASGAVVATFDGGFESRISSDGTQLFVARDDRVDVVSMADGSVLRSLPFAEGGVEGLALAPDDAQFMVGDKVYDGLSGELIHTLSGHTDAINGTAFSPDGRLLATSSWDRTAKIWDRATGQLLQTLVGHTEILFGLTFAPDSRSIMTGSLDNTARLWDVASGRELRRLNGHTAAVYTNAFTPDGRYAATASADGSVRIWDLTRPIEGDTLAGHSSFVFAVAFSPDSRSVFTGSADGTGYLWDTATLKGRQMPYEAGRVDRAAFSPDGRLVLLAHELRPAELWDVASAALAGVLDGSSGGLTADFSADGNLLLASAAGAQLDGQPVEGVGLWDVASRQLLRTFAGGSATMGALSPDGRRVVVATDAPEMNVLVYDASSGELLRTLENGSSGVASVAFAPDSRHILTGSRDNNGRIFDIETGAVTELVGHTNVIWGTAFSPDGLYALTGSQDRSARLWDVGSGTEVRRFASHQYSAIAGIAIAPDGKTIAIGSFDGFTQLTPFDLGALREEVCGRLLRDFLPVERQIYEIADEAATCP